MPEGTRIRVGTEERTWAAGQCLVFDDSFEHEVWHEGSTDRIVLICDMWHPQLDFEREVLPTLTEEERRIVAAARSGKHLPLTERLYTTGSVVRREP